MPSGHRPTDSSTSRTDGSRACGTATPEPMPVQVTSSRSKMARTKAVLSVIDGWPAVSSASRRRTSRLPGSPRRWMTRSGPAYLPRSTRSGPGTDRLSGLELREQVHQRLRCTHLVEEFAEMLFADLAGERLHQLQVLFLLIRWRQQQEHAVHRFAVEAVEIDTGLAGAERADDRFHQGRAAVRDGDAVADAGRADLLARERAGDDLVDVLGVDLARLGQSVHEDGDHRALVRVRRQFGERFRDDHLRHARSGHEDLGHWRRLPTVAATMRAADGS